MLITKDDKTIPKVIHYCWFGRKALPPLALKCIESWRKYLPDYEIKEWNEDNFDVNAIPYVSAAYEAKKFAFVSDYARFWILYNYGGLYFDTDVEVIKPLDDIIAKGPFMGRETTFDMVSKLGLGVAPGLGLGAVAGMDLYRELLATYEVETFEVSEKMRTIVDITTELLVEHGLENSNQVVEVAGVNIYPAEYFNPINLITKRLKIMPETRSIHWYCGSWMDKSRSEGVKSRVRKFIPERILLWWNKLKH